MSLPATSTEPNPDQSDATKSQNGLTDEQVRVLLAAAGRRKNDADYLEHWDEEIAQYRRRIQEEVEHELAKEPSK